MIGFLAHTLGAAFTLHNGFQTFESTCYALDNIIDKRMDIFTHSPYMKMSGIDVIKLRSKSERKTWFAYEDLLIDYTFTFAKENNVELVGISRDREHFLESIKKKRDLNATVIIQNMGKVTAMYAIGDAVWNANPDNFPVRKWLAEHMTDEHRLIIINALVLYNRLCDEGRVEGMQ